VLILFSLPVLSFAAAYGIHNLGLGLAWSFLTVGVGFILLAIVLFLIAKATFKKVKPPEKSMASAKQSAALLQGVKPHPRPAITASAGLPAVTASGSTRTEQAGAKSAVKDNASAVARSST
jgi:hypothetical protein